MPIPLTHFLLDDVAGSGGTGVVWRGRHARRGLPVAVKVLPPREDRLAIHAYKNEVQAVARLHHPHVVSLLDTGVIDEAASKAATNAGHTLVEGSPWLAVELASGGDLHAIRAPVSWPVASDVLRTLLSALAHAHARGVVHKDLKPNNVLLCTDHDVRPGLKLTDFGLALSERSERLDGGTPQYMAPEQFDGESQELGPWTDLYALGCLAFWLTTGAPPFTDETPRALALRHVSERAPRLPAGIDAPPGFADWVARLLEKNPAARFRCAADADAALVLTDPTRPPPPIDRLPDGLLLHTSTKSATLAEATTLEKGDIDVTEEQAPTSWPDRARAPDVVGRSSDVSVSRPPRSWRAPRAPRPDLRLVEAGLSLWGLRQVPLVGREAERDELWGALLDVHASAAPRVVVVRGPSGVGKSRLVEWIAHRALETGAATVLRATFQPLGGRSDGIAGLVGRVAGLRALEGRAARAQASTWISRWLPGADVTADELCALAGKKDGVFSSGEERQSAFVRLLAALARERPLFVWLDDVQHGKEALALVERAVLAAPELRALFVATAVEELLDADAAARLGELEATAGARTIRLAPLDEDAHDELCGRLLGGDSGGLADELRRRTEGNALFAVQVVGDWAARGLLEVKTGGLALKPGIDPVLPDELHALWDARLAAAVGDDVPAAQVRPQRVALELAAVLGSNVDLVEWETAVRDARGDVAVLDEVVDALVAVGLARRGDAGFQFAHVMVRGSVERRAQQEGRLAAHHACAASALSSLWGTDTPAAAARIGRHLLAAGSPQAALLPLLSAARAAVDEGDVLEASAILAEWERARARLGLVDADARVAPGLVLLARVAHHEGRHDEARELAARAASAVADLRQKAAALRVQAAAVLALGDAVTAAVLFAEAHATSLRADDKPGIGAALRGLGDVEYYRGDHGAAAACYAEVAEIFASHGKKSDLAASLWSLGYVEMERGAFAEARRLFLEQRKVARGARDRLSEANAENALGELARRQGNLDEAEDHYRAAARIASRNGLSRRWIFYINLAHVRLRRGDVTGAQQLAAEFLSSSTKCEPLIAVSAWWIVAAEAAARADLAAFDRAADAAIATGAVVVVEEDLIHNAELAAAAVARLDPARAERARAFAEEKRRALRATR